MALLQKGFTRMIFDNLNLTDDEIVALAERLKNIFAEKFDVYGADYLIDITGAAMIGASFMQELTEKRYSKKNPYELLAIYRGLKK